MQIGAYQIERELGRGGFGIVYVGIDQRLGRRAAIKQLLPELSSQRDIVERFFNEAKAAASIDHPGIVEIYDVGWHVDGSAYFAMKLLEGESLGRRLRRGKLSIGHAATIARQVASALVAAHARGIVHRDLKPDNIVLIPDDEISIGERAVIVDFGIAKLGGVGAMTQTRTGVMMGTPGYMSPEQCKGAGEVDHRTDIYALGCIVFEMLTGRVPFVGEGPGEVMGMHQFVEPPLLRSLRPDAPAELEMLVSRLLAKKLDRRMQQISELPPELGPFATGGREHLPSPAASAALPAQQVDAHAQTAMSMHVAPEASPVPLAPKTTLGAAGGQISRAPHNSKRKLIGIAAGIGALAVIGGIVVAASGRTHDEAQPIAGPTAIDAATIERDAPAEAIASVIDAANAASSTLTICKKLEADRDWAGLATCADELARLGDPSAQEFHDAAVAEQLAQAQLRILGGETDPRRAERILQAIPERSIYRRQAEAAVVIIKANAAHAAGAGCNEAAMRSQRAAGNAALGAGEYNKALSIFDSLAVCDGSAHEQAYLAACHIKNAAVAKRHFAAIANKRGLAKVCADLMGDDAPTPSPSKADFEATLKSLVPKVQACYATHKAPGRLTVHLAIGPSGLRAITISPPFTGTPTGTCVDAAIRSAKFPVFQGAAVTVQYSYLLGAIRSE